MNIAESLGFQTLPVSIQYNVNIYFLFVRRKVKLCVRDLVKVTDKFPPEFKACGLWWSGVVSTLLCTAQSTISRLLSVQSSRHWRDLRCASLSLGETGRDVTPVSTMLRTVGWQY